MSRAIRSGYVRRAVRAELRRSAEKPRAELGAGARWWFALKPASWPKLIVPSILGQALGISATGGVSPGGILFGAAFTLCDLGMIVLLNDWGDREVDAIKRRMFPDGCSPKTIPDGILPEKSVLLAGLAAGVALVLVSIAAGVILELPGLGALGLVAAGIFAAYTFPPIALNYRGGGELLEMIGVGGVLPLIHYRLQGGALDHPLLGLLAGALLLSLSSALASGLSDEESDRAGGKRTFTTAFGNGVVRRWAEALLILGAAGWIVAAVFLAEHTPWWIFPAPLAALLFHGLKVRATSGQAVTSAFGAQGRYKGHLHRAIWDGMLWLAAGLVIAVLVRGAG